jgi:MacB-like periplasmic core domain/FtsX-like permease family
MHLGRWLDIVRLRLRSLLRVGDVEQELDRELRFHIDREAENNIRLGETPAAARSAALRRLGGVTQIQEECRDMRRTNYIENLLRDLQYAGRTLVKAPAFTVAAIATLALGIGANTAIFQLLDAVRLRSLPVPEPHRLAQIEIPDKGGFGISHYSDTLSYPLFQQIRDHQEAFLGVFAWRSGYTSLRVGQGAAAHHVTVMEVSGEFFPTLGISSRWVAAKFALPERIAQYYSGLDSLAGRPRAETGARQCKPTSGPANPGGDRSRSAFHRLLVVTQVAISLILVSGAFLFVASFRRLVTMDPGFRAQGVLEATFGLGGQDRDETTLRQLLTEVRATPRVESAAATTNFIVGSGTWSLGIRAESVNGGSNFTWVSPAFFVTLGTPVLAGRDFSTYDSGSAPKVAIVNEIFARTFFPGADPIGKTFRTVTEPDYPEAEYEIVGLVKNTRYFALQAPESAMAYGSISQFPPGNTGTMIFIRSSAPLPAVEAAVRRRIAAWRAGTTSEFKVFQQSISDSLMRERLLAVLSGFFGVLAALLASIGLYGVLAYQIVRRRSEIGIRLALGATRGKIMQMVLQEAAVLVCSGLALGLLCSLAGARAAASFLLTVLLQTRVRDGFCCK